MVSLVDLERRTAVRLNEKRCVCDNSLCISNRGKWRRYIKGKRK